MSCRTGKPPRFQKEAPSAINAIDLVRWGVRQLSCASQHIEGEGEGEEPCFGAHINKGARHERSHQKNPHRAALNARTTRLENGRPVQPPLTTACVSVQWTAPAASVRTHALASASRRRRALSPHRVRRRCFLCDCRKGKEGGTEDAPLALGRVAHHRTAQLW